MIHTEVAAGFGIPHMPFSEDVPLRCWLIMRNPISNFSYSSKTRLLHVVVCEGHLNLLAQELAKNRRRPLRRRSEYLDLVNETQIVP